MLLQLGVSAVLIIAMIVLFVWMESWLGRICLLVGGVLLIGVVNVGLSKLMEKKDGNGNVIHSYYVAFTDEKVRERARPVMEKYGTVRRKTSKYDSFSTGMTLAQARNTIRSNLKISEKDFEIFEGR